MPRRQRSGTSPADVKAAVRARDGFRCTRCGLTNEAHRARCGKQLQVHRLKPRSAYTLEGCVTLCSTCHGPQPKGDGGEPDYGHGGKITLNLDLPEGFLVRIERQAKRFGMNRLAYIRMSVVRQLVSDELTDHDSILTGG